MVPYLLTDNGRLTYLLTMDADVDDSMVPLSVDETKPDMPLPPPSGTPEAAGGDEWAEATDEYGTVYYFNPTTGESAWTKPTAMATE
jgi:hypothetical protein